MTNSIVVFSKMVGVYLKHPAKFVAFQKDN